MTIKEVLAERWEKGADFYNRRYRSFQPDLWRELLAAHTADMGPKLRVLDVGTGPGQLALLLAKMGHTVEAVDLSRNMLRLAEEYAKREQVHIRFTADDAEELSCEDDSFDLVTNRLNLWTLPRPGKFVFHALRVLRKRGKLLIFIALPHNNMIGPPKQSTQQKHIFTDAYERALLELPFRYAFPAQVQALLDAAGYANTGWSPFADTRSYDPEDIEQMLEASGRNKFELRRLVGERASREVIHAHLREAGLAQFEISDDGTHFLTEVKTAVVFGEK